MLTYTQAPKLTFHFLPPFFSLLYIIKHLSYSWCHNKLMDRRDKTDTHSVMLEHLANIKYL